MTKPAAAVREAAMALPWTDSGWYNPTCGRYNASKGIGYEAGEGMERRRGGGHSLGKQPSSRSSRKQAVPGQRLGSKHGTPN